MMAYELYALEMFLSIQGRVRTLRHAVLFRNLKQFYAPVNWMVLPQEERDRFNSLSELLPMAEQRRETLIPVLIDGRLEFHVAENFDLESAYSARAQLNLPTVSKNEQPMSETESD